MDLQETVGKIASEVSESKLLSNVEGIIQYHRIQSSPGHRAAAEYLKDKLIGNGVDACIYSYPYNYRTSYLGNKAFQEWSCTSASCRLVSPDEIVLADFPVTPTSLMQRSGPFENNGEPLDIVYLNKGKDESAYEGLDLSGKMIFIREDKKPYIEWAIERRGAVGVISDYSDDGYGSKKWLEIAEVSKYAAFWYYDEPKFTPFGFSIPPLLGDRLEKICLGMLAESKADPAKPQYPQVVCHVDSSFYDGMIEVVEAELKGETDEEILITAHSCHPRPSANDNASGVAAAVEAICALNRLISLKKLPPLKRTIKVLLMPEFSGTVPYLSEHAKIGKCIAGINLDMVGGKQSLGYGPLTIVGLPYSTPSIAADLCGSVLNELRRDHPGLTPDTYLAMFNSQRVIYSSGSDHIFLSDPQIGMPAPMLLQWPDTFYHTGGDDLDKISPELLSKSCSITAAYVYLYSNLQPADLQFVFSESLRSFISAMTEAKERQGKLSDGVSLSSKLKFIYGFYDESASSACKLFSGPDTDEAAKLIEKHREVLRALYDSFSAGYAECDGPGVIITDSRIPVRTQKAIIIRLEQFAVTEAQKQAITEFEKDYSERIKAQSAVRNLIQYHMDGKKTVDEIIDRTLFESRNTDREAVYKYLYHMEELGICRF